MIKRSLAQRRLKRASMILLVIGQSLGFAAALVGILKARGGRSA